MMSKIASIFEEVEPLDVIWNAMIEKNPELIKYGKNCFRVLKIMPYVGARNTEARVVGIGDSGIEGIMSVFYDRASLTKVANNGISPARKPTITVAQAAGAVLPLATILPQINALLGFNLVSTGNWLDLSTFNVTVPARGTKVSFTLQGVASATGGFPPVSIRTLPGTTLTMELVNRGQAISAAATERGLNPFIKADGNINWGAETISADPTKTKKSLLLKIINVDFSDLINEVSEFSNIYYQGLSADRKYNIWPIRAALAAGIKQRCIDLGLPAIDFGAPARQSGLAIETWNQLPLHREKFLNSVFRYTAQLGNVAYANTKFAKCLLTNGSFQNAFGFVVSGIYSPIAATVEAKEGWATDLANYPINYNLP